MRLSVALMTSLLSMSYAVALPIGDSRPGDYLTGSSSIDCQTTVLSPLIKDATFKSTVGRGDAINAEIKLATTVPNPEDFPIIAEVDLGNRRGVLPLLWSRGGRIQPAESPVDVFEVQFSPSQVGFGLADLKGKTLLISLNKQSVRITAVTDVEPLQGREAVNARITFADKVTNWDQIMTVGTQRIALFHDLRNQHSLQANLVSALPAQWSPNKTGIEPDSLVGQEVCLSYTGLARQ